MHNDIIVVSTGYDALTEDRCKESSARQTVKNLHLYANAARQMRDQGLSRPLTVTENLCLMIGALKPADIVVWLDGDDWLAGDKVLETVLAMYEDPAVWVTHGSYEHADGRPGVGGSYGHEDYRRAPWLASHLKTFRAALFQAIPEECFLDRFGNPHSLAVDQAVMFPMLEMAGAAHVRYCPEVLCIYNYASSFEHGASTADLSREREASGWIRSRPSLSRLAEAA